MATKNNPVVGYRKCPDCGQRGSIHQVAGTRHQLYQRCGCGCVQSNGAFVQSRFWYETEWTGEVPTMPPMVLGRDDYQKELARVAAVNTALCPSRDDQGDQAEQGLEEEAGQVADEEAAPIGAEVVEKKGGGIGVVLALGVGLLVAALGVA